MKSIPKTTSALLALVFSALPLLAQEKPLSPGHAPAAAVENWKDSRYGMFIHWGPVSLKGTEIGWSRGKQVPIDEYDNLYKKFNPTGFDADKWVAVAKAGGMKYIVLTAKHHDGFCLWDSKLTDYNIMHSPFKRDVVKELAEACKKGGIAFGIYYSSCDWYHPSFPLGSPGGTTRKPNPDLDAYDVFMRGQLRELSRNYGPIFTFWFDVPQSYGVKHGVPMVRELRQLQPNVLINNRAYSEPGRRNRYGYQKNVGDYETPEQKVGKFQTTRPWETCMTICRQWAWKPNDELKSLKQCLQTLVRTSGGDGNFLFNVGPMPDGRIEQRQADRLAEMGDWLQKYGDSIYGTRGGPFIPVDDVYSTRKGDKIYLHLLDSRSTVTLPISKHLIKSSKVLTGGTVTLSAPGDHALTTLTLGKDAAQEIDAIVELILTQSAMDMEPRKLPGKTEAK
ncbi:MAG: alpha-L-fucosidase [Akkermansiaceae bacterium]|nr:alpha-L-fucosidase [Akkermansiaceae bacterium]